MTRRSALITGGASGIGAAVASRLAQRGYHVIAVDRTAELAEQAAADIGPDSTAVGCDLADEPSISLSYAIESPANGAKNSRCLSATPGSSSPTMLPDSLPSNSISTST